MTGYGQPEDKRRARDAGFDEHLVKPVDPAALQRALGQRLIVVPRERTPTYSAASAAW